MSQDQNASTVMANQQHNASEARLRVLGVVADAHRLRFDPLRGSQGRVPRVEFFIENKLAGASLDTGHISSSLLIALMMCQPRRGSQCGADVRMRSLKPADSCLRTAHKKAKAARLREILHGVDVTIIDLSARRGLN